MFEPGSNRSARIAYGYLPYISLSPTFVILILCIFASVVTLSSFFPWHRLAEETCLVLTVTTETYSGFSYLKTKPLPQRTSWNPPHPATFFFISSNLVITLGNLAVSISSFSTYFHNPFQSGFYPLLFIVLVKSLMASTTLNS